MEARIKHVQVGIKHPLVGMKHFQRGKQTIGPALHPFGKAFKTCSIPLISPNLRSRLTGKQPIKLEPHGSHENSPFSIPSKKRPGVGLSPLASLKSHTT